MTGQPVREHTGEPTATGVAAELVRGWVELYTGWVSAPAAERRRAEIRSDLWEQQAHAREVGAPRIAVSLSIARRATLGIPADVLWVHKQRAATRSQPADKKARTMNSVTRFAARWWWALGAAVLAAVIFTMGLGQLLEPGMPYLEGSIQAIVVSFLLAAGVVLKARMPRTAAALIVAGAATPAVLWWAPLIMVLGIAVELGALADLVRRLAQGDLVLGALSAVGGLALGAAVVGYAWLGSGAGPVGLMWLAAAGVGVAILLTVAHARPAPKRARVV
ncbi:hypothetical protein [Microbacterium sp. E-13]|uniref:hypothetical protein n=1 Tax=Microbacterium sp. E-13 TaxID=3404048 RepID=UPI003CF39289